MRTVQTTELAQDHHLEEMLPLRRVVHTDGFRLRNVPLIRLPRSGEFPNPLPRLIEPQNNFPSFRFDFGELAFTLLGVESKVCRKRFICEMSVNYRRNPIVGSAYTVISRQFFPQYAIDIDSMAPKSVKQCAMMFRECRGPTDPIPEDSNNGIDESVNATAGENEAAEVIDQSRAAKPKLDQVQRFVVGSKKTTE